MGEFWVGPEWVPSGSRVGPEWVPGGSRVGSECTGVVSMNYKHPGFILWVEAWNKIAQDATYTVM